MPQQRIFDVVVVGSGASGGTLAAHLAQKGLDVCIVEGGPPINTRTDFNTHSLPFHFPNRHIPTMKPDKVGFTSERSRGLGGKSQLWNAVAWRYSQRDFKGKTYEDAGEDWPVDYAEMSSWYSLIEKEVGVCGNRDGLEDLPDGDFLPAAPLKCSDISIARGAKKLGVPVIAVRKSTLTVQRGARPACHWCGNCMAGCDVVAKYNSWDVHLAPARRTGKLTVQPNSIVAEVLVTPENKVNGVRYVHRETKQSGEVQGRAVVVSAACVQSIALLQMSKSRLYPKGLGNHNDRLGHNFVPHFTSGVEIFLDELIGKPSKNDEGFLDHAYIPSFMHNRQRSYARSFGMQFNYQNRRLAGWARTLPGIGKDFKQAVKDRYPAYVVLSPYGEKLPNANTYVDLDPEKKDEWGLPVARRNVAWNENDWRLFQDMTDWAVRIAESAGAEVHSISDTPRTNHELGGICMGDDPKRFMLDRWCRSHSVPNLYVVDGSVFPSASEKNPTHTMMALAARTASHIAERFQQREL
jgi:choline dehydrogenase-like flavoprotein